MSKLLLPGMIEDKPLGGFFTLFAGTANEIILPNNISNEGKLVLLQQSLQDNQSLIAAGGNYYIGLGSFTFSATAGLADITELAVANGYARKAVLRSAAGWPVTQQVQNAWAMTSAEVTFTASGGSIGPFNRMFLCSGSSGTGGKLIAVSSALATPITLTATQAMPATYTLYLQ